MKYSNPQTPGTGNDHIHPYPSSQKTQKTNLNSLMSDFQIIEHSDEEKTTKPIVLIQKQTW